MTESLSPEYNMNEGDISDIIESLMTQYSETFLKKPSNRVSLLSYAQKVPILNRILPKVDEKQKKIDELIYQQSVATSYSKWYEISLRLDEIMDNNLWKLTTDSDLYDYELIFNNLNEMKQARLNKDYKLLLYLIRTKWVRNIGNMGDINLYKHSLVGTKRLIEEYIGECKLSLQYLINDSSVNLDDRYLLGMLIQTRKNIGRTALVLSGGSTFGMFHIGVLVSLLEVNLLPRIISGSSAGSIVASILCCHNNEENKLLIETLSEKEFRIFESNDDHEHDETDETGEKGDEKRKNQFRRLLKGVGHFLKYGTVFEMEGLKRTIKGFVGDLTFREAYNRTGKILNITVSPAAMHEQTRLLNYLTAPNCLIWSAVCASCSLPGFFPSTSIYEKNPRTNKIQKWNNDSSIKFVDGSVDNDLPITRLSEMFNVDHIIAVQVNPHVVPILRIATSNPGVKAENELTGRFKSVLNNIYDLFSSELVHFLQILSEMDIYKNLSIKCISLLSQSYSGDITILPNFKVNDFQKIFDNPTPEFIADFIIRGARATWPKVTIINNHCGVEFELDKAISLLRGRSITSNFKSTFENSLVTNPVNVPLTPDSKNHELRRINSLMKNAPKFRRQNSSGNVKHRRQRNSISNFQTFLNTKSSNGNSSGHTSPNRERQSNVSLSSMSYNTPSKKEFINNRANTDYHEKRHNSEGNLKIRKAKSSGNFHSSNDDSPINQHLKYQTDRVPNQDQNPYIENEFDSEVDYLEYFGDNEPTEPDEEETEIEEGDIEAEAEKDNEKPIVESPSREKSSPERLKDSDAKYQEEKAYLPKRSQNSSLTNSYIGLNRLKDANLSKSSDSSNYNEDQTLQLNSPDIRRVLTKKMNELRDK
ncbi:triacylglycerol lipase 4 [[Candida] jaroonii]|uniref:Triacylglycerol lipase 4 n=1 Tax=[Candida] jaroonii TaxID=467808 RepID=A0ACA9Y653_9ASCO|nr:triacylglycerol lipase 4 [[Candida] jaroonii]